MVLEQVQHKIYAVDVPLRRSLCKYNPGGYVVDLGNKFLAIGTLHLAIHEKLLATFVAVQICLRASSRGDSNALLNLYDIAIDLLEEISSDALDVRSEEQTW